MKSLTESILSTSGVGLEKKIHEWLEYNDVIHDKMYKIKNGVIYPDDRSCVHLFQNEMNELPGFIKFADGDYSIELGVSKKVYYGKKKNEMIRTKNDIKSFRGLPKQCGHLEIDFPKNITIPSLDIQVTGTCKLVNIPKINGKLKIEYAGRKQNITPRFNIYYPLYICKLEIDEIEESSLSKIELKDFQTINLHNAVYPYELCNSIFTKIRGKAPLNKANEWTMPVKPEANDIIDNYFKNTFNMNVTGYSMLYFTDNWLLFKYGDDWYKCENKLFK